MADPVFTNEDFDIPGVETAIRWAGTRPAALELLPQFPKKKPGIFSQIWEPEDYSLWKRANRLRKAVKLLPELPKYHALFFLDEAFSDRLLTELGVYDAFQRGDLEQAEEILKDVGDERISQLWRELGGDPEIDAPAKLAAKQHAEKFRKMWVRATVDQAYKDVLHLRAALGIHPQLPNNQTGFDRRSMRFFRSRMRF